MKLISEPLSGVKVLKPFVHKDPRGDLVKPFHKGQLAELGIDLTVREEFFSTSQKRVVRGMHFQSPPYAHSKLIYCIRGSVLDVVLDIRINSPTYGKAVSFNLTSENHHMVYIPQGFAHGFASLESGSCLIYKTDMVHTPIADSGILWNSFGFEWPFNDPLLSERDSAFQSLAEFQSPFTYQG